VPPLSFDFRTPRTTPSWWKVGLLIAGLAVLAMLGLRYHRIEQQREAVRWHLNALSQAAAPISKPKQDRVTDTQDSVIRARMAMSWQPVFDTLETATPPDVYLLSVNYAATAASVRLTAEARTLGDALDYVTRLDRSAGLGHAILLHYTVKENDPEHPVSFEVKADVRT